MKSGIGILALLLASSASAEPLLFDDGRVFIAAEVNGVATEALLDSGAEASLIDDDFARAAKLAPGQPVTIRGSGGTQQASLVSGAKLAALGLTLEPEAVVVMDLGELSQRLIRRPTQLVLGREIFDSARLRIDIHGQFIEVVPRDEEPAGAPLELVAHAGIESIPVTVGGIAASAEFDLGNGSGVGVSRALADRLGLKVLGKRKGGGIGQEIELDVVRLDRLEVAGVTFTDVDAFIDDQPNSNDLNIGTSILKHFILTTDFPQRKVWLLARNGDHG